MVTVAFVIRSRSKVQLKAYWRVLCVLKEKTDQQNTIAPKSALMRKKLRKNVFCCGIIPPEK